MPRFLHATRVVLVLVATLACIGWSTSASAWSRRVHAMIGDIATQYLKPQATLTVADLLRDDLGADDKPSGLSTLGQVASWADDVRTSANGRGTYNLHFDDIPICGTADKARYCPDGRCASAWFDRQRTILKDPSQPRRVRNEALKWIVHLAGDLHQPLHASDHDDKGGNDVRITWYGKRADDPVAGQPAPRAYNLHTAWDRLIPYRMIDARGGDATFLAQQPDEGTKKSWESGDLDAWIAESHAIARDFVYPMLGSAFACDRPVTVVVDIGETYDRPAEDIAALQVRKAGVRLAKVLNDLIGAP